MSKITSETLEQKVRRLDAAHLAARKTGQVVPSAISNAAAEARKQLHRQTVGPERFDAAQAWGTAQIKDRASRLVARQEAGKDQHGRERMSVVSQAQFDEIKATGTTTSPIVHEPAPKFGA